MVLKSKIVQNYKTSPNFLKFIDIYNIIIDLNTRDGILSVMNSEVNFFIFNHSLTISLQRTPPMLFRVEIKKNITKKFLDCL